MNVLTTVLVVCHLAYLYVTGERTKVERINIGRQIRRFYVFRYNTDRNGHLEEI